MNTNPNAVRILCYGDSNTHGRDPKRKAEEGIKTRYPSEVRWTSQLQDLLGSEFEVIEEGLGGRTTNLDDPESENKNGLTYLKPCLDSHVPLDLVILMLGTNDLKTYYNRSASDIAQANKELIEIIKEKTNDCKILLLSAILVDETNQMAAPNYKGATQKSKDLSSELRQVATDTNSAFLDLSLHVNPSKYDGIHIDQEDQVVIAKLVHRAILELYQ